LKGELSKWFDQKGFGFINGLDGKSYFVHISQVQEEKQPQVGDNVKFEVVETKKGEQAHNVVIL
jgi:CspA family cold shock protein